MTSPAPSDAPPRPPRSARLMFAMTVLVSEVFVIFFATLVAHGLRVADLGLVWGFSAGVTLLAVVAAGLLRRGRAGYVLGTVVQVLLVAAGFVVPMMLGVGIIFAVLWAVSWRTGGKIDRERAERYQEELRFRGLTPADGPA